MLMSSPQATWVSFEIGSVGCRGASPKEEAGKVWLVSLPLLKMIGWCQQCLNDNLVEEQSRKRLRKHFKTCHDDNNNNMMEQEEEEERQV